MHRSRDITPSAAMMLLLVWRMPQHVALHRRAPTAAEDDPDLWNNVRRTMSSVNFRSLSSRCSTHVVHMKQPSVQSPAPPDEGNGTLGCCF